VGKGQRITPAEKSNDATTPHPSPASPRIPDPLPPSLAPSRMTAPSPKAPPRPRSRFQKITLTLLSVYLILCLIMFSIQNWMIFPGHATQAQREAMVHPAPDFELLHLTTAIGDSIVAIFGNATDQNDQPLPQANSCPTILFFYGNAMCLADSLGQFHEFRRLGANVMIVEYPGYGMSGGTPSEPALYAAADAACDALMRRQDIDPKKIIAAGWSLGAAVAINLATRRPVAALATFSAFTSLPDMARSVVPWLPTSLLLRSRFDNQSKIKQIACPIFIAHGTHDSIVPFAMSRKLIAAAKGPATSVEVDSDHNDIFERGGEALDERFKQFLAQWHGLKE
jgi:uncharacterized protein